MKAKKMPANTNDRKKRTLRSTLVEPFKQVKIGVYVMVISLTFLVMAAYLFVAAFMQQYQHVMEIFNVVDPNTKWELVTNDIFYANVMKLGALCFTFIAVLFWVVFKMTHKMYGPLVSIERFVDNISQGHYGQRIVIRRGDDLKRLAGRLNHMAETLQAKHGIKERRRGSDKASTNDDGSKAG